MSEPDVRRSLPSTRRPIQAQASEMTCFAGAGVYDHEVPAVVKMLAGRSEFVTPIRRISRGRPGVLQAIFEYQTLISRLSDSDPERVALRRGDRPRRGAQHGPRRDHSSEDGGLGRRASALARSRQDLRARHRSRHRRGPVEGRSNRLGECRRHERRRDRGQLPELSGVLEDMSVAKQLAVANDALFVLGADPVAAAWLKTAVNGAPTSSWAKASPSGRRSPSADRSSGFSPAPRTDATTARSDRGRDRGLQRTSFIRDDVARAVNRTFAAKRRRRTSARTRP